jgi:hypothetical protein
MFPLYQQIVRAHPVELSSAASLLCYFCTTVRGLSLAKDSAVAVVIQSRAQVLPGTEYTLC